MKKQPWIRSAWLDGPFILAPAFLCSALVLVFPSFFEGRAVSPAAWIALVLCVDVSHVYGSLYRTYFDAHFRHSRKELLFFVPVFCWVVGAVLYSMGGQIFWSALAYLAVFHFVRQQYGFFRIYSRRETRQPIDRLDGAFIYLATIYPLAYWHAHLPRAFHWFVEGDFLPGLPAAAASVLGWIYLAVAVAYATKEVGRSRRSRFVNWPKQLLALGTALSWYVGIVGFNGDLAFTMTNVVAHGVPYFALVWAVGRAEAEAEPRRALGFGVRYGRLYSLAWLPVFLGVLLALAFLEEGLWDGFVWREHGRLFALFGALPAITSPMVMAFLAPLLALPQSTHYVLDGLIWKLKGTKRFL